MPKTNTAKKPAKKSGGKAKTTTSSPEVTPVSAWKPNFDPMELPSGKFMRIRKVAFQAFMKAGVIPNSLMATVEKAMSEGDQAGAEAAIDAAFGDEGMSKMDESFKMIDAAVVFVALEPKVYPIPMRGGDEGHNEEVPAHERDLTKLYVDEIDDGDKMFIFQYATGGVADVEQFRRQQVDGVDPLQRRQVLGDNAE